MKLSRGEQVWLSAGVFLCVVAVGYWAVTSIPEIAYALGVGVGLVVAKVMDWAE